MAAESDLVLTEEESEPRRHDTTQRRPRTTTSSRPELRRGENDDGQISWCERDGAKWRLRRTPVEMVSPRYAPSRRVTRSQSADDRKPNRKLRQSASCASLSDRGARTRELVHSLLGRRWLRSAYMSSVLVCAQATTVFSAYPSLLEKILNLIKRLLSWKNRKDATQQIHLNFEDILLVETQAEVIVTYSIPDEGGDPKWEKEVIDPRINNLVRGMREGHEFKATYFRGGDSSLPPLKPAEKGEGVGVKKKCLKPSRRFGKASDEPGCLTQTPQRPIRPRRGILKQAEPGNSTDKEQELKEWIRVELKTQLGKLRDQFFDWLHHDRGGSFTVPQNTADGKTNRDNKYADPTAWKFQRSDVRTVVMVLMKLKNVGLIVRNTRRTTAMGLARMRR
ncbi:hypothetical protein Bca52824_033752 [Brassica carinata]|uniref:Uncharacterized protein n=1 Tax=Brassica carinata TaxID=52824 RepID=A0A8X7V8U3_BRACI|nr:hypothetical protein Bca52824_033752 [Brassica carinata]